ncbi:MAG: C39 family peptidase [Agitococcus sp.]
MFLLTIGSAIMYMFANDAFEVADKKPAGIYYRHGDDVRMASQSFINEPLEQVMPLSEQKFKNIAHQTYDYSCGSAALTSLLNGYLGRQFTEKQIMDGMLKFGEYDKIVQRRGFSLLDMKRLVLALGHTANGFKGSLDELKKAGHPAIVAIHYMNFKHFVIVKKYQDGRFFVADPALGNITFTEAKFDEIWEKKDGKGNLFIVFPNNIYPAHNMLTLTDDDLRFVDDQTISYLAFMQMDHNVTTAQQEFHRNATMQRVFNSDAEASSDNKIIDVPLRTYFKRK